MVKFEAKVLFHDGIGIKRKFKKHSEIRIPRNIQYEGELGCQIKIEHILTSCRLVYLGCDEYMQQNIWYDGIVTLLLGEMFQPFGNNYECSISQNKEYLLQCGNITIGKCILTSVIEVVDYAKMYMKELLEKYPFTIIPSFEKEIKKISSEINISGQALSDTLQRERIMRRTTLPVAINYYKKSKYDIDKERIIPCFMHEECKEVIPMLLEDFYSPNTSLSVRTQIGLTLRAIKSRKFIDDYIKIISNPEYGEARKEVIRLVGELKVKKAIPILVNLLEDESIRNEVILALDNFSNKRI